MSHPTDTIYLQIAGFNIKIYFQKTEWNFARELLQYEIQTYCEGFITKQNRKKVDFQIDIEDKREPEMFLHKNKRQHLINFYETTDNKKITTFYQISIFEFLIILRDVLERLLNETDGFFLHASATNVKGKATFFVGKSGAGKSTIITLINENYPALADDSVIVKKESNLYYFYQTPLLEKNWRRLRKSSKRYIIKKVFFIRKAKFFNIKKVEDKNYILQKIHRQVHSEKKISRQNMKQVIHFVSEFNNFYLLYFKNEHHGLIDFLKLTIQG